MQCLLQCGDAVASFLLSERNAIRRIREERHAPFGPTNHLGNQVKVKMGNLVTKDRIVDLIGPETPLDSGCHPADVLDDSCALWLVEFETLLSKLAR